MTTCRLALWGWLVCGAAACGSSASGTSFDAGNDGCTLDADCGNGACVDGICTPTSSSLKYVMVEVSPPAGLGSGAYGQLHYLRAHKLDSTGTLDIELDGVAELTVAVSPPSENCPIQVDDAGDLPIVVEAIRDGGINGIAPASVEAESASTAGAAAVRNLVALALAPGLTDIHIVPIGESIAGVLDEACDLAPILALGRSIPSGRVSLKQRMPVAEHLRVDVSVSDNLEGWILDLVEPFRGRRISSRAVLGAPTTGTDGKLHHEVRLAYHSVTGSGAEGLKGAELLRLSPPSTVLAPTFYVARSATNPFDVDTLAVSQVPALSTAVTVHGLVESAVDGLPVRADVVATLEPTNPATKGALASFQTMTSTDSEGRFSLALLSGNYEIVVIPSAAGPYASFRTDWTVAPDPSTQTGRLLRVGHLSPLTGVSYSEVRNEPLAGATLIASPSTFGRRLTFLDGLLGQAAALGTRSQMIVADEQGAFEMPLDAGRYDITVRPAEGTGFPWAVRPNVDVESAKQTPLSIQTHLPMTYSGTVSVPGQGADGVRTVLPDTLLRFYALFDESGQLADDATLAVSGVEIGHVRSDASGRYRLLLPDRLD